MIPTNEIRVIHLVGGSLVGGAGRGALWLHQGLRMIGVRSSVLADSTTRMDDPNVRYVRAGSHGKLMGSVRSAVDGIAVRGYPRRQQTMFSPGLVGHRCDRHPDFHAADVVHVHWINGGFVNIRHLRDLNKPIVWTLRDMWPITGGCHYSMGCNRFTSGCGECPQLGSRRTYDLSRWGARRKRKGYPRHTLFVAISSWLADEARRSWVIDRREVVTVGNNVSCADFYPVARESARRAIGIRAGAKKVVLAGAQSVKHFYKGFDAFIDALRNLDRNEYMVVLFGRRGAREIEELGFEVQDLGYLADTISLRAAYSAADVFVAPSRMEAFGKTLAEAMACGCPVVCFDATGPRDIVDHEVNGYRARAFDPRALAQGIEWVTADAARWSTLSAEARAKVERSFDTVTIARRYQEIYARLLAKPTSA